MRHPLLAVLIAALWSATTPLLAQQAPPAPTDSEKHGIVRRLKPRTAEPQVATTEAAAAAIAAAIRSAEETKKPEPQRPHPARPAGPRVKPRRYEVLWPSQRLAVEWETPDERVTLSWQSADVPAEPARDDRGPKP